MPSSSPGSAAPRPPGGSPLPGEPARARRTWTGWAGFSGLLLLGILVPFFLFADRLEAAARALLASPPPAAATALVLGGLLAGDVVLPVPSSFVSTAAGGLLGFWRGTAVSWAGMMAGSALGYWLGARAGAPALRRMVGEAELARLARAAERHGPWFLLLFRGVPVLSEASVVFAGAGRMPRRAFVTVTALANLGISATYAAVGASAAQLTSILLLFAGIVLLPGLALLLARLPERWRRAARAREAPRARDRDPRSD
ncbi:TVP38/TMEM64 family protein [Sorangium sp. So ce1097]|uniref:TVP38/TMEM64 family protein n=1 Tax=Sorangium sp. So ce1097 TaxID=3133330 RepID=UPI003F5FEDA5